MFSKEKDGGDGVDSLLSRGSYNLIHGHRALFGPCVQTEIGVPEVDRRMQRWLRDASERRPVGAALETEDDPVVPSS